MRAQRLVGMIAAAAVAATVVMAAGAVVAARQGTPPRPLGTSAGINGLLSSTLVFMAADADQDGVLTRDELKAVVDRWFTAADSAKAGAVTREQLTAALNTAMPASALAAAFNMGGRGGQPQTPQPVTVAAMMAALPDRAPALPLKPRKVLVLAHAGGFVHSSIPLAAKTIDALGAKTGAWSTTISYDAADITAANLSAGLTI